MNTRLVWIPCCDVFEYCKCYVVESILCIAALCHSCSRVPNARRKSIPMEVAVAFNGKYGRHCIPLEFSAATNQTEPKLHPTCSRRKCVTCKLRIPTASNDDDAKIQEYISIQNKHGTPLDLTRFYNKCVPNLPPDLVCPSCRCRDKRSLVLSTISYPSNTTTGQNTLLTYTPRGEDDDTESENGSDSSDEQEPQRKKRRLDVDSFAFPSRHDDLSMPTKWEPLERANDVKHAIAIHCVSCQNFGVVAPAGPCYDARFPCVEKTRQVTVGKHAATIGGVYVRRKCSNQDCLHTISCEACSREVEHAVYDRDTADDADVPTTVAHKTSCQTCNLRYCNEDAWLSTICHHW